MSRYTDTVRYASRHTGVNFEKYLTWGAIGLGLYVALSVLGIVKRGAQAAGAAYDSAVSTTSDALYRAFGPSDKWSGENRIVTFPDGSRHQVAAESVNSQGYFVNVGDGFIYRGDGKRYRLIVNRQTGAYSAVLA